MIGRKKKKATQGYRFMIDGVTCDIETFTHQFFKTLSEDSEMSINHVYAKHEELLRTGQVIVQHEHFDDFKLTPIKIIRVFRIV